jgi:hypothetical protein
MELAKAQQLAEEVRRIVSPYCLRVEVAGGVRREKPEPHDVELVCVPKFREAGAGLFGPVLADSLQEKVTAWVGDGPDAWIGEGFPFRRGDPDKAGKRAPCGPRYYRLKFRGEKLDLFAVLPPAQWGVVFAIRTGDALYSHWLVQQGWPRGIFCEDGHLEERWKPNSDDHMTTPDHVDGMLVQELKTPEEGDVFRALGVPHLAPKDRLGAEIIADGWERQLTEAAELKELAGGVPE